MRGPSSVSSSRHAGRSRSAASGHSYLHRLQAALDRDSRRHTRGSRILRPRAVLAQGKQGSPASDPAARRGLSGFATSSRLLKIPGSSWRSRDVRHTRTRRPWSRCRTNGTRRAAPTRRQLTPHGERDLCELLLARSAGLAVATRTLRPRGFQRPDSGQRHLVRYRPAAPRRRNAGIGAVVALEVVAEAHASRGAPLHGKTHLAPRAVDISETCVAGMASS